jgi:hypothetical protein
VGEKPADEARGQLSTAVASLAPASMLQPRIDSMAVLVFLA